MAIIMIFCNNASLMFMPAKVWDNNASLMFMPVKVWDLNAVKIVKIYAFVHQNLFAYREN